MFLTMLKSKIHRAKITDANLNYEGSITIDPDLMSKAGILPYEAVHVFNINTGDRFVTYAIEGKRGSGDICLNGAAARLGQRGDLLIIVAFIQVDEEQAKSWKPVIVHVDENNKPI
ncbi:MAG TPA: aspartate 1-decarboxylase [Candidatus Hydrogenedens sp.]|nr:aspartate 1-decarboxylase [Candidatus Hydrogenedens sp.]HOK08275.1 aspartate 1-decarboxylase [Candidatus Hydrogenedens sp.]HOL21041.1 aspartate 1-decarboxylase [Candidatus Hydrogenedens sp.]HPP59134.1 aspartate 1-decarboxylase [Candidatus Hydrogenedens sp.]